MTRRKPKFKVGQVVRIWGSMDVGKIRMKRWIGPDAPESVDSWCYWMFGDHFAGYFPESYLRKLSNHEADR
jgi:protoporphyrinogen oxidase